MPIRTDAEAVRESAKRTAAAATEANLPKGRTAASDARFSALADDAATSSSTATRRLTETAGKTSKSATALGDADSESAAGVRRSGKEAGGASAPARGSAPSRSAPSMARELAAAGRGSSAPQTPSAAPAPNPMPQPQPQPQQMAPVRPPMAMQSPPTTPHVPQYPPPTAGTLAPNVTGSGAQQPKDMVSLTPKQMKMLAEALAERSNSGSSGDDGGSGSSGGHTKGKDLDLSGIDGDYQESVLELTDRVVDADIPYAWGGGTLEGPSGGLAGDNAVADQHGDYNKTGFDCSGFSRFVTYQTTGIELPRTAAAQYDFCEPTDEPKIGDLGFPPGGNPGHVVVYVGNGQVCEAQQSGTNIMYSDAQDNYEWRTVPGSPNDT